MNTINKRILLAVFLLAVIVSVYFIVQKNRPAVLDNGSTKVYMH